MLFCLLLMLQSPARSTDAGDAVRAVNFRGELLRRDKDGFSPIDAFDLIRFVDSDGTDRGFALVQAGVDRDRWTNTVGTQSVPHIRHIHDGVPYRLELVTLSIGQQRKSGDIWTSGRRTFRVGEPAMLDDRPCQEVFVSEGPARNHKLLVDSKTGDVLSLTQRVFMGRGDEFRLTLKINPKFRSTASDAAFFNSLLKVREAVGADPEQRDQSLSASQLKIASTALPDLQAAANSRWAKELFAQVKTETTAHVKQTQRLADLKKASLGKPFPSFQKSTLDGKPFGSREIAGKVTVFHIWKYREEPLNEPYGQTAYLDFLKDKFAGKPVQVVGINIDTRFSDSTQVSKANRSARKLVEFMNLSYPIVGDDGSLLGKIGDPRAASAELPLWVVVDKAGTIRMWKTGFYKVDVREGLKELRDFLTKLAE